MVSSKLTVDDFSSFLSLLIARKKISRFQIFFFTFGLRYLEDRSGVEVATKIFVVSMLAENKMWTIFFFFCLRFQQESFRGSLCCFSK